MMDKRVLFSIFLLLTTLKGLAGNQSVCQNPQIKISGPREVVYSYKKDHCSEMDIPDTPAMAFKDAEGMVHLFNGFSGSYMSVGKTLNEVKRDCSQPFTNEVKPIAGNTPDSFDNWKWFRSPWTYDGKTIYSLIHNEFHGWEQPQQYCPSGKENPCLYPNVTVGKSTDSGKTFHTERVNGQVRLGLVSPYPYVLNAKKQGGIRASTNIISANTNGKTYYYLLASNRGAPGQAQKGGTCLYRSDDVSKPGRWRAWNGKDFSVVVNATPYRDKTIDPTQHLCTPVFSAPPSSWTYNTLLKQYVATVGIREGGSLFFGYVTSPDMINWSQPQKIMKTTFTEFHASHRGSGVVGQTYPSILDPQSPGLNFEYSGQTPYLYFTRFNPKVKGGTWHNRDLMRVPLQVSCG
ncbi:Uncharacterised protein [Legionella steigerwaltii]|uniref:Uncharacterized protein n=1 Tax=Legionella steigerwaltii TaxID=460 RepID=A0A378L916_9GAMM|nr:hypothetical protein [Legionella steigerwaltii]KTD78054.1 hypothetical protein Lstg_1335 [Legionella steigerwaltii]STY22209.1 Uncharacterised protein [Legionella steigerwaltii]